LEEDMRLFRTQGLMTNFIKQEDMRFLEPGQDSPEAILFAGFQKPFYGIPATYVIRRIAGHAGTVAKTQHEVRFPYTRRAKKDDILFAFNEGKALEIFESDTGKPSFEPGEIKIFKVFCLWHP